MGKFNDILFVFPVMVYYMLEAFLVSVFITLIARLLLNGVIGEITYMQWVGIYWIAKMLFFDVFKLVAGLKSAGSNMQQEMDQETAEDNV